MKRDPKQPPQVFISHRHGDKAIADMLRNWMDQSTAGRLKIFQSSEFASGPKVGKSLSKELLDNLWHTDVLLLVYTMADHDWSYCMYECGVATDPQSPDTRVVVLQFSEDAPAPFEDQVRVNIRSKESIAQFANQFLTDEDFFPQLNGPISGYQAASSQVQALGAGLFEAFQKIPKTMHEKIDEWPAWPFIRLQMSLDAVKEITDMKYSDVNSIRKAILGNSEVIFSDSVICGFLNTRAIPRSTTLAGLVAMWTQQFPNGNTAWVNSLIQQIYAASNWQFPKLDWSLLKGQRCADVEWYSPVLAWVRKIPYRNSFEFDIYFLPFYQRKDESFVRIQLPNGLTQSDA